MLRLAFLVALCALLPSAAFAQQASEPVEASVRALLERETAGLPGQVEITVGQLDPANRLPPCASLQAFLPSGMRAWGQVSTGVRCDSPVVWTVYVPARVAVHTEYLVTQRPLRPGQIISPEDVRMERGDLAALPNSTLTDPARVIGTHVRQAIAAGQPLRQEQLRLPPAVEQGQTVRIVGSGTGFNVSAEGRAMNRAGDGEGVRVRLPNGQVVTGTARAGGIVEMRF